MDPFDVFGLEPAFDLALGPLERRYRELSRVVHPDRYAGTGASERRRAMGKAVDLNEAWRILRDPTKRAESLLHRLGVAVGETHEPPPDPELLMTMMERREELSTAREAGDRAAISAAMAWAEGRQRAVLGALGEAFDRAFAPGGAPPAPSIVGALGELRYLVRFLDEARAFDEDLAERASVGPLA